VRDSKFFSLIFASFAALRRLRLRRVLRWLRGALSGPHFVAHLWPPRQIARSFSFDSAARRAIQCFQGQCIGLCAVFSVPEGNSHVEDED
jgi:hypothetical protein